MKQHLSARMAMTRLLVIAASVTVCHGALGDNTWFHMKADAFVVPEGTGVLHIPIHRHGSMSIAVTVQCTITAGSAEAIQDYEDRPINATESIVYFAENQQHATCPVRIYDDTMREGDEEFTVELHTPSIGTIGDENTTLVTIEDNEGATLFTYWKTGAVAVSEGAGSVVLTIVRVLGYDGESPLAPPMTVVAYTENGNAKNGMNFVGGSRLVTFPQHAVETTVSFTIIDDMNADGLMRFYALLRDPNDGSLAVPNSVQISIIENDVFQHIPGTPARVRGRGHRRVSYSGRARFTTDKRRQY